MNVSRNSLLNNFKSLQSCSWIFYEDETRGFPEGAKDERENIEGEAERISKSSQNRNRVDVP